jgi:hypothetical protein
MQGFAQKCLRSLHQQHVAHNRTDIATTRRTSSIQPKTAIAMEPKQSTSTTQIPGFKPNATLCRGSYTTSALLFLVVARIHGCAYPKDDGNRQPQAGHAKTGKEGSRMITNGDCINNAEKARPRTIEQEKTDSAKNIGGERTPPGQQHKKTNID